MQVNINFKNLDKLKSAFRRAPASVTKHIGTAINKSAMQIIRETKPLTPVDTNRLRGSIGEETREGILQVQPFMAEIGTRVNYARFVHHGTRFMQARPFLQRGTEKAIPEINRFFQQAGQNIARDLAT